MNIEVWIIAIEGFIMKLLFYNKSRDGQSLMKALCDPTGNYLYIQLRLSSLVIIGTRRQSDRRRARLGIDKMDMKKLIMDFRHFQRERQKTKLVKKKMSSFNVVKYQRGADELTNVTDTDITSFDDDEATLIVELFVYDGQETVTLQFVSLLEKQNFVAVLAAFLQLSNSSSSSADSGRSTIS
ncbi:uncharacterized protein [Euwallacea similis]|uniref:uncharacterized protein isoform X2 n=1 Tax=Euwallacea similis TaxID=1736056 RepID=UPI00344B313A